MNGEDRRPVMAAVMAGDVRRVAALVEDGHCVDVVDDGVLREHPLHVAVSSGHVECLEYLLRLGCDVNVANTSGETPLLTAVACQKIDCLALLLDHPQINVNKDDNEGKGALHCACQNANFVTIKMLLRAGCRANHVDQEARDTPLHTVCRMGREESETILICKELLRYGADLSVSNYEQDTPIHLAAYFDRYDVALYLLDELESKGHDVPDDLLVWWISNAAVKFDHPRRFEFIERLLHLGLNPNRVVRDHSSPLEAACRSMHRDAPKLVTLMMPSAKGDCRPGSNSLVRVACMGNLRCLDCLLALKENSKLVKPSISLCKWMRRSERPMRLPSPMRWEWIDDITALLRSSNLENENLLLEVLEKMLKQGWRVQRGQEKNVTGKCFMPTFAGLAFNRHMHERREVASKCIRLLLEHGAEVLYECPSPSGSDAILILIETWPFFVVAFIQLGVIPPEVMIDDLLPITHNPHLFLLLNEVFGCQGQLKRGLDLWKWSTTPTSNPVFRTDLLSRLSIGSLMKQCRALIRRQLLKNNVQTRESMIQALDTLLNPPMAQYVGGLTDLPRNMSQVLDGYEEMY